MVYDNTDTLLKCVILNLSNTAHGHEPQSNQPLTLTVKTPQCGHIAWGIMEHVWNLKGA